MPREAILCGGKPVISLPLNQTWPELGLTNPVMILTAVVFPEPFRPIIPRIWFSATEKLTRSRALTPPKPFETSCRLSSSTSLSSHLDPALDLLVFSFQVTHDPLGLEQNERHEKQTIRYDPERPEIAQHLRQRNQDKGAQHRARQSADSAHDRAGYGKNRKVQREGRKPDEHIKMGEVGAGEAAQGRADPDRDQLIKGDVDARSPHRLIVVADGAKHESEIRRHEPPQSERGGKEKN